MGVMRLPIGEQIAVRAAQVRRLRGLEAVNRSFTTRQLEQAVV